MKIKFNLNYDPKKETLKNKELKTNSFYLKYSFKDDTYDNIIIHYNDIEYIKDQKFHNIENLEEKMSIIEEIFRVCRVVHSVYNFTIDYYGNISIGHNMRYIYNNIKKIRKGYESYIEENNHSEIEFLF